MLAQPLPDARVPVLLSAHDETLITQDAWEILGYLDRLGTDHDPTLDIASTLSRLRRVRRHRAVVRAADRSELVAGLSALAHDEEHPLVARSSKSVVPSTAFVFPGQGNQWQAMGADAYRGLPAYRAEADRCAEAFAAAGLPSPLAYLQGDDDQNWSRTQIQGAQFVHAISLASQWRFCGVVPGITIGHSLGEVAAAYLAEKISLPDAVALVGARAAAVDRLTGHYAMAVLGAGLDEALALIGEIPDWLEVSAVNGPSATVVSGGHDGVVAVAELAKRRGVFAHQLTVDYPGHTSALRPLHADLDQWLPKSNFRDSPMAFIGSATGAEVGSDVDFASYWYESLCSTVRFDRAVVTAQKCGADTFVELSAHPSLVYPLVELVGDDSAVIVGSGHRDAPIADVLSANIAAVAIADPGYPWADTLPGGARPPLRGFPNAPMRAVHLWAAPEPGTGKVAGQTAALTIAVEDWQPAGLPTSDGGTRCGIAIVGDSRLTRLLAGAASTHEGCAVVPPGEAEIVAVIAPELDQLDAVDAVTQIAGRADAGLPDYDAIIGPRCRAVWLLTAGGERVLADDAGPRPAQSALAAMHRSVGFEFGDQTFGSLDLPMGGVDELSAVAVIDALLGDTGVMALRANTVEATRAPQRFVRTLRQDAESVTARPLDMTALENVVITGGSGAIGQRYAQYCIQHGARRVILLSRNGVEPEVLNRLAGQYRVEVLAPQCDITDRSAVSAAAAESAGGGASMLIHTAGIATATLRADLTGAGVAAVCAAKVTGLAAMADVWPLRPDCRILACSSVFGVWGGHGHAAYAASNRILDALAAQLRSRGLDCTAIRWGLWQDAGVVAADEIARTQRSGLVAMRPEVAVDASLGRFDGDPLIFDADFDRLRVFFESQGIAMPLPTGTEDLGRHNGLHGQPLADVVRAELAATLHVSDSVSIDPTTSLIDLGLDSLLALDLRRRLRRALGHSAPVARMLGGITVSELIDVLGSGAANGQDMRKVGIDA